MLVGGYRALRQTDLKLILAYGTVSQLGFLTMVVGLGRPDAALAGLALLLAHGLFKAALFLVVGIIDHQIRNPRHPRSSPASSNPSRALAVVAVIGAASMAGHAAAGRLRGQGIRVRGVRPLRRHGGTAGTGNGPGDWWCSAGLVLGSILTFAYSARFMWGGVRGEAGRGPHAVQAIQPSFLAAPAILSLLTCAVRAVAGPVDGWIQPYAAAVCNRRMLPRTASTSRCGTVSLPPWG